MENNDIITLIKFFGNFGITGALSLWAAVFLLKELRFWKKGRNMPEAITLRLDKIEIDMKELFKILREYGEALGEVKGSMKIIAERGD
jgi:hypothetical protein